ncbi:hypothetical protein Tco_1216299 [Tanacetum coccineum]
MGETKEEFINFLSESLTARIKEQVKDQLPQILPKKVSNFAPPVIEKLIKESRDEVTLEKIEKSESYLDGSFPEHRDCYDGLKKSYALDKDFFYSYDVYSLKRGRKDNDKDEDPSAGSNRGLKKRKTSKDAEPTTCLKKKYSTSGSSKGTKSQPKYFGKSVQSEELVFEVEDSDLPQDQEGNLGDNKDELRTTDPDWNIGKTTQEGPTQNWLITLAASTSTDKSLKDFDELTSTPIDFSGYILNGLKIKNLTQEILLGPAFRLLKGIRSNYAELEYDFKECYRGLFLKNIRYEVSHIGDNNVSPSMHMQEACNQEDMYILQSVLWQSLMSRFKEGDFPRLQINDIEDMLILVVPEFAFTNLSGDDVADFAIALRMFTRSLVIQKRVEDLQLGVKSYQKKINVTKPDTTRLDLRKRHSQSRGDVYSTKRLLAVTHVKVMRKHGYGYLEEIVVRIADNVLYRFKEGDFPRLRINDIEDMLLFVVQNRLINLSRDDVADFAIALRMFTRSLVIQKRVKDLQLGVESYQKQINVTKPDTTRPDLKKRHPYTPYKDPQGFIYVDDFKRNRLMRSDELYKFSDGTLTRLLSSLEDITKNIDMEYLPKRRWSTLEKKRAHFMIKDINKLLKERRMMRSLEKFVGGRLYGTDLRLLQRTI